VYNVQFMHQCTVNAVLTELHTQCMHQCTVYSECAELHDQCTMYSACTSEQVVYL